jgi:UDPglucose 6-dehydrogenase
MQTLNVAIIGTGYVGLTTGVTLAYLGHKVTCLDIDQRKLELLRSGEPHFHEPHLREIMRFAKSNLAFTDTYGDAIPNADVVFIAVGTPSLPNGNPDLQYLRSAAEGIGTNMGGQFKVIINKSTVPIGSGNWVEALISESSNGAGDFAVASNPEFLREGAALSDSLYPDRIVIGTDNAKAREMLFTLYEPLLEQSFEAPDQLPRPERLGAVPFITTDLTSAELIKYAANAFLSLKVSFINEIANLSEKVGADVVEVARGIGLDSRIGTRFLQAGIGWGGSCFGKDTAALIATAHDYHLEMPIVEAARLVNRRQRNQIVDKLLNELKILKGRTITLLGLSFKPNTDDLRDAPAYDIAKQLLERGAWVRVHDPIAMDSARSLWSDLELQYCEDPQVAVTGSDAVVLVTDWTEYRHLPWETLAPLTREALLIDGRNHLDPIKISQAGFRYVGIGRKSHMPQRSLEGVK